MLKKLAPRANIKAIDRGQSIRQFTNRRFIVEPVAKVTKNTRSIRVIPAIGKVIIHPKTVFFKPDKACLFKYFQMFGNRGLGYPQDALQLTDTHRFMLEELDDFDPIRIR